MRIVFAPPHQQSWSPPPSFPPLSGDGNPYKQGESAVRFIYIVLLILLKHLTHPIQRLNESINIFL